MNQLMNQPMKVFMKVFIKSFPQTSNRTRKLSSLFFTVGLLVGPLSNAYSASAPPSQNLEAPPISTLLASGFCGHRQESVQLIKTQQQWAEIIAGRSRSPARAQGLEVDFQRFSVLYISMGAKTSSGYGLSYNPSATSIDHRVARITVEKTTPKPNHMSAQVMTKPCLALKIDTDSVKQIELNFNQSKQTFLLTEN